MGLVLYTLVPSSQLLARDQAFVAGTPISPALPRSTSTSAAPAPSLTPGNFTAAALVDQNSFSATDFRPRKHTLFDAESSVNTVADAPMLRGTTVWQRMAEYKSHDRVRLLTLWESSGSSVSLQAGKRGDPSLQWTSRWMNRGGSTRGLLDQLFAVSFSGTGGGLRGAARSTGSSPQVSPKQVSLSQVAGVK